MEQYYQTLINIYSYAVRTKPTLNLSRAVPFYLYMYLVPTLIY